MDDTKMICADCVHCVHTVMRRELLGDIIDANEYYCTLQSCDYLVGETIIECNRYEKERDYDYYDD